MEWEQETFQSQQRKEKMTQNGLLVILRMQNCYNSFVHFYCRPCIGIHRALFEIHLDFSKTQLMLLLLQGSQTILPNQFLLPLPSSYRPFIRLKQKNNVHGNQISISMATIDRGGVDQLSLKKITPKMLLQLITMVTFTEQLLDQ